MSGANRIDQTPVRISTNISIERQTAKSDFGDRIQAGLSQAAGVVANGAAMAAPFIPGGAVVSAAVSSLNTMGQQLSAGSTAYAATGVTSLGGGGGLNTTVGGAGTMTSGSGVGGIGGALPGAGGIGAGTTGGMNVGMSEAGSELGKMLQVQMQVQKENQVFTTVSNVLKTRHDTVKNTISNVR